MHDDRIHFEFLTLEGAQAGLSWETILRKREGYRRLFAGFDPREVARFSAARTEAILANPAIVRNRRKVEGTIGNAKAFLRVAREFGSFDEYVWRFVNGKPIRNARKRPSQVPARTAISDALSGDLRVRGFSFVGPTIVYAYMQAIGMVNDHLVTCFRYELV